MAAESSAQSHDPTLVENLLDRQRDAWQRGERVFVETLVEGRIALAEDRERLLDLVCNEIKLRFARGETPELDEYQKRFPALTDDIRKQFEVAGWGSVEEALESKDPHAATVKGEFALSDGEPIPPPTEVPRPEIEGYEILGLLGQGGMGVVYKARQKAANRVVALKMILGGFADDKARARFSTEAHAVARLQHPNVVQVFEVCEHRGLPFFSLEFCAGGALEARLHATPLPPAEAARLMETLARAVHHAHERGIVHRDLKPGNVLLTEDGTPKIADFGLAKKLDETGLTQTEVVGSPPYMAPEQTSGKSKEIGPATDVYALGAILYECLTGRPPFKAATAWDTLKQVLNDDPVPPRQLNSGTPRDLETICLKCLQKEPEKRYASAADLAEDLRRFQARVPIVGRPVGRIERAWSWSRRNPKDAALIGAGLLAFVAGLAIFFFWQRSDFVRRQEREEIRRQAVTDFWNAAEEQQREGRYGAAAVALGKAVPLLQGRPDLAEELKRLEARRDLFGRLDEFRRNSDQAWFFAGEERGAAVRIACEQALRCYGVLDRPDWQTNGPAAEMPAEMAAPVQREVHRLLLLAAGMRVQQAILASSRLQFQDVKPNSDLALDILGRAQAMEAEGTVGPSRTIAILEKGARGLSGLPPASAQGRVGTDFLHDLSAEDGFFLGVMHVYLAKHQSDKVAVIVRFLGPQEFDYDHPRNTAVELLRLAVRKEPRQYWACWMLGRMLAAPGPDGKADYEEAVLAFTNCISLRPDYSRGYEQRGLTLAKLARETRDETTRKGIIESVDEDFAKANALAPNDPSTWWVRGQVLQLSAKVPEALAAYTHALDLTTDLQDKVSMRNQLEDPKRLVREVLAKNPNDPDALRLAERIDRAGKP
jgi:tRNA A-37 threonylcarbamoyl transferase component Bud32/tetratricopeptide (TPR) repeat protein